MENNTLITLTRDCNATAIPAGTRTTLLSGTEVTITQSLGGTYTVMTPAGMFRVDEKDADALGKESRPIQPQPSTPSNGPLDEKLVWDQLRTCYDPEIPVNIVDLGLVYSCQVAPLPQGGNKVDVKMTLTAPGCGMGASIAADAESKMKSVPGVTEVHVELVWEPTWNQSMMTEAAKLQLGLL